MLLMRYLFQSIYWFKELTYTVRIFCFVKSVWHLHVYNIIHITIQNWRCHVFINTKNSKNGKQFSQCSKLNQWRTCLLIVDSLIHFENLMGPIYILILWNGIKLSQNTSLRLNSQLLLSTFWEWLQGTKKCVSLNIKYLFWVNYPNI